MKLSARAERLKPSETLAITAKAKALKSQGIDVIGFGAGEPDFDSPLHVKEEAIRAINEGMTKYTGVGGIDELKDAIIHRLKDDHNLEYEKSEIIVSVGAKHALYNIIQVLFDTGDEVVVPAPYWVSYPEQIKLAEATPVILKTKESEGFKITPESLRQHINSNTKALILNYPSNPTGATYNEDELRAIVDVAMDAGLIIISDEIYEKIIYGGVKHVPVAALGEDIKKSTILVNGVSKTYSMTGWRIGYAAGDKNVISAMGKLQGQSTSNPSSISQWAAIAAFRGDHQIIEDRTKEFEQRKNYIVEKLNDIPEIYCFDPQGAFYVFPNVSGCYGKEYNGKLLNNSMDFTEFILDEAKVAVVPGIAFGSDDHVRISYATSMDDIVKGIDRIAESIKKLS
jgi:aspartate aminotransferase